MTESVWLFGNLLALLIYAIWGLAVARRHSMPGLTALICIVPLWTTVGAFLVIQWRTTVETGAYSLLERQTFPILLDGNYAVTVTLYWLFCFFLLALLSLLPPIGSSAQWMRTRHELVRVLPSFPLWMTAALAGAGIAAQEVLTRRMVGGLTTQSLYAAAGNPLVSGALLKGLVYSALATSALIAIGASVIAILRSYDVNRSPLLWVTYSLLLILQLRLNLVTGDRSSTLLLALSIATSVLTLGRRGQMGGGTKLLSVAMFGVLGYFTVLIGMSRANSRGINQIQSPLDFATRPGEVWSYFASNAFEGEATSAHASLYFILERGVEPFQLLPVFNQTYGPYASQVGLPPAQGFTIHLVGGWWMSVGPLAPIAAAVYLLLLVVLLGWVATRHVNAFSASFAFVACASALAGLGPDTLRSGPDALRGTLTTVLLVPALAGVIPWAVAVRRSRASANSAFVEPPSDKPTPAGARNSPD